MRTHEETRAVILENSRAGRGTYDGLSTDEIAAYNRRLMFGENDEAFPPDADWSRIVD